MQADVGGLEAGEAIAHHAAGKNVDDISVKVIYQLIHSEQF